MLQTNNRLLLAKPMHDCCRHLFVRCLLCCCSFDVCFRWLLAKPVHGTLFADYGSDLDSGESVIGDPAGTRGKPGRQVVKACCVVLHGQGRAGIAGGESVMGDHAGTPSQAGK